MWQRLPWKQWGFIIFGKIAHFIAFCSSMTDNLTNNVRSNLRRIKGIARIRYQANSSAFYWRDGSGQIKAHIATFFCPFLFRYHLIHLLYLVLMQMQQFRQIYVGVTEKGITNKRNLFRI